jgi:hypothetical protein
VEQNHEGSQGTQGAVAPKKKKKKKKKFQVDIFWILIPCSVVGHQRFTGPCCHRRKEGGSMDL